MLLPLARWRSASVAVAARARDGRAPVTAAADADAAARPTGPAPLGGGGTAPSPLAVRLDDPRDAVRVRFKRPPRAGAAVRPRHGPRAVAPHPTRVLPIASLTKMMTALLVAERCRAAGARRITAEALRYTGSGVGLLPRGKRIRVETMLHGLLLPSGQRRGDRARPARGGGSVRASCG